MMEGIETCDNDTSSLLYSNSADMMEGIETCDNDTSSLLYSNSADREEQAAVVGADDDDKNEKKDFSFCKLPARSKYTLLLCCLANMCVGCSFAVLAPFFPQEAEKKGVSTTVVGFIFSVFELVIFISSPLYGNYLTKIGAKFMFTSGICVGGCCSILFGLLDKCPPGITFTMMCFATRCVEALALSAFITSSFAILSNEFPNNIATVIGLQETANGMGMMIGPAVGGALYQFAGYGMPFFVLGGLMACIGVIVAFFLPLPQGANTQRKGSVLKLVSSPIALISMLSIVTCAIGIACLDPILAKHLKGFHLSTAVIGLVFVIAPAFYAICSPLWGYLVDKKSLVSSLIVSGHLVYGLSFFFIGPSPWLPFLPSELWVVIIGAVMLGIGIGCAVIPNMKCLVQGALEVGFEDNLDTYGIVSGLFNSMFCVGAFSGPMVGGVLVSHFGFDITTSMVGVLNLLMSIIALIFFLGRHAKQKKSVYADEKNNEARGLLTQGNGDAVSYSAITA